MAADLKQKVKCVCSHYISLKGMEKHLEAIIIKIDLVLKRKKKYLNKE